MAGFPVTRQNLPDRYEVVKFGGYLGEGDAERWNLVEGPLQHDYYEDYGEDYWEDPERIG